jgi:subtilisin family serine protease
VNDAIIYATSKGSIIVACAAPGWGYFNDYPPACDRIMLVGSVDGRNKRLTTSYGRVDFMAPGERIYGESPLDADYYAGPISGPIPATALVTGIVSLMLSIDKSLTFRDVYDILSKTASDQVGWPNEDTPGWDQYYGWGTVNAYRAVRLVLERSPDKSQTYGYGVSQNYPNPAKLQTTIEYEIPRMSDFRPLHVSVKVYDVLGRLVATLVDELQQYGYHHAYWNANVPSGVYFYRLQAGDMDRICKMIVVK